MPQLQKHMYRVAGVAQIIGENFNNKSLICIQDCIIACLLHDMGNIIKCNLEYYPQFIEREGIDYWQKVKSDFIKKYGNDEHIATLAIAQELHVSSRVLELIQAIGFSKATSNANHFDYDKKLCCYADQRVTPFGVRSLDERLVDGHARFKHNHLVPSNEHLFLGNSASLKTIEQQLFDYCTCKPDQITEEQVSVLIPQLMNIEV